MHFFQSHSGFIELFILYHFPDMGFYKYNLLDFCVTHIWETIPHILESTDGYVHTFQKVLMRPSFMCNGGQINFLQKNKRRIDDIFLPWRQ